jgi:HPt (histidine-containing phosphotransfer) domain-containing protein
MKADIAAHLKELLELEDDEIQEFYDAFIKEFDKSCTELQEEGVDSDYQKLRIITHTMFGYCENMGAMDLFALAKELNAAAKAADTPACQASIRKIFRMHEAYLAEG